MTEEFGRLVSKRGSLKCQLTSFKKFIDSVVSTELNDEKVNNILQRLNKIEPIYDIFVDIQAEIDLLAPEGKIDDQMVEREEFDNKYFNAVSLARSFVDTYKMSTNVVQSTCSPEHSLQPQGFIKLPPISLPSFDGKFTRWKEFHDSFLCLINNNTNLTNVQRLTYLKASLKDEPFDLIRSLETTDVNYSVAWSLLQKRYDNKRRIINNHVQSLLDTPPITKDVCNSLRRLTNHVQNHVQCLSALGQPVDQWDAILIPIICSKLDMQLIRDWEANLNSETTPNDVLPKFDKFLTFLINRQSTLENIIQRKPNIHEHNKAQVSNRAVKVFATTEATACTFCKQPNHSIYECESFKRLDVSERNKRVKELNLCINCLRHGHFINKCQSRSSCRHCHKRHHSFLHSDFKPKVTTNVNVNESSNVSNDVNENGTKTHIGTNKENVVNFTTAIDDSEVLLSTARVNVSDAKNKMHEVKVLLDSASQSNFITNDLCELLNLEKIPIKMNVSSINQNTIRITHKVTVTIKSRVNNFEATITCLVVPRIVSTLPTVSFSPKLIQIPLNIQLADPTFFKSSRIEILIGASLFYELMCVGQIKTSNLPIFQETKLGWVISGSLTNIFTRETISCITTNELHREVERFWKTDEFITDKQNLTEEEEHCETNFKQTTIQDESGRFIVKIPFKDNLDQLGNSRKTAECRLQSLEKRFEKDANLKLMYKEFLQEYKELNHMTEVEPHKIKFFLPHHAVIKETSETTKLRVVFDASCKLENGLPINETQCTGPTIQDDLFSIIARFRTHNYVLTADIAKMYRCVLIHSDHRQYQGILWRDNPNEELKCYVLNTVTYGTTAAPFLAIRCLIETANLFEIEYPREAKIIKEDFYVDDMLTGADTISELEIIKQHIDTILRSTGFCLRKWASNSSTLKLQTTNDDFALNDKIHKILGMQWNPKNDVFTFTLTNNDEQNEVITKRRMLAKTAQLFDPLGLLGPVLMIAKLIIQELWQKTLGWDDEVPNDIKVKWITFRRSLKDVNNLKIPRQLMLSKPKTIQIHTFADASEKGYGACIYIRSTNDTNEIKVNLIAAKSRVAPLKKVTLPRLELCAAVLASQLAEKFRKILRLNVSREYFWSDSCIVLAWLQAPSSKWKTYVANRVSAIQELTKSGEWRYVKSTDNAADILSRGISGNKIVGLDLWWKGPYWLSQEESEWPKLCTNTVKEPPEMRKQGQTTLTTTNDLRSFQINNYSSLNKLKRIVALCLRFQFNCKTPIENRRYGSLSTDELTNAIIVIIKIVQNECFEREIKTLTNSLNL